jgi:hypothetical protein
MKKISIIIGIIVIIVGVIVLHPYSQSQQTQLSAKPTVISSPAKTSTVSYKGENGVDALTLLKQKTSIEQDHSGLVVAIKGNKPTGHTYWAFYVNGKLASVGPAAYKTKNTDVIVWKIEKY